MRKYIAIVSLIFICFCPAKAETPHGVKEVPLDLIQDSLILAQSFDMYPDDYTVKISISNDGVTELHPLWGIGGFANIDNWDPTYLINALEGESFDIFVTIGDLKTAARNGNQTYVESEYGRTGICFNIYNGYIVTGVSVYVPVEDIIPYTEKRLSMIGDTTISISSFVTYPDDYKVKIKIRTTYEEELHPGWNIGGFANADNLNPTYPICSNSGEQFDVFATIGDLKKAAKNGTNSYVVSENNRIGVTFYINNGYAVSAVYVLIPQEEEEVTPSIVGYEYWYDDDFDARVKVDTVGMVGSTLWLEDKRIDASGLGEGIHQLCMRAKNSKNLWSNIEVSRFYIDREPETRPALKEVRRYRYMFSDGTMKYGEVGNPSLSITDKVIAEAPSPTNIFIDKNATTFTFPDAAQEKSEVTMTRELEYCFALQYENDQNGWCPPVVTNFTRQHTLNKDAHWLDTGMECSFLQPHRGNFEVVAFEIFEKGNYAIKSSNGVFTALYKKATEGDNAEWVNFAEVSPSELAEGYREYYDAGSYFGVIYTPEQYEDGQEESLRINLNLMTVCDKPEIIVNGNMVTIGGLDYDVTYYYTTDGTEPTTSSQQYTAPFTISSTCVVKAIAVRDGSCDSDLAAAYVKIGGDEDKPKETERVEARFDEGVLTLTCPTENAVIYYGINQEPQKVYSAPLQLTDNRPVYFYAQAPGYEASGRDSMEISYFRCKISAYSDRYIRLKCDDDECTIHWMQDSDEPSESWTTQTGSLVTIWNSYTETYKTVRAFASSPYKLNSDTIAFDPDAIYQFPYYYTFVNKPGTLSTAYEWLKDYNDSSKDLFARMIKVDGVINHDDLNYIKQMPNLQFIDLSRCEVVEKTLPDSIFAGMNIRFFRSPANLTSCGKGILAGCKRIGGVEWNSRIRVPDDILGGVDYPNLLLYVNSAAYANANLFHNLVTNGVSTNITLKDAEENGCFFAIASFWAKKISYTRDFKMTTSLTGESQGWETITLPFEVQKVTHETNGSCAPFGYGGTYKNFWLSEIVADKFASSSVFPKISYQYIVSMPNNVEYSDECILGGNVTFSASNVWVESTNSFLRKGGNDWYEIYGYGNVERFDYADYDSIRIYSNYEYLEPSEERSTINVGEAYGEYNPGSVFVPGVFGCKPFEAYIEYVQKEADGAPRRGPVVAIGKNTTGIKSIPARYADDEVYSDGGKLYIYSDVEKDMPLYNVTGQLVKVVRLHVGENVVEGLHSGTYIVKGKKFMINYRR